MNAPHSYAALRIEAIESLLIEKGLLTESMVDEVIRAYEDDIGPLRGATVVARAWVDEEFKARLLKDAPSAVGELGIAGNGINHLVALENTPAVHNVVVCTLCSCYPWGLLGLPPSWYKSPEYRARAVREPREVLREFGVSLPPGVEVRVWDSSSEVRYMVLPQRPYGTGGLSEEQLIPLVSRNSMIGTALPTADGS